MSAPTLQGLDPEAARERLAADEPLELDLPGGGYLHFGRGVPFLTVYDYGEEPDRFSLHAEEVAYCVLGAGGVSDELADFLRGILSFLAERFGGVVVVRVRVDTEHREASVRVLSPASAPSVICDSLLKQLAQVNESALLPTVELAAESGVTDLSRALGLADGRQEDILLLGLTLGGFFLDEDGRPYPLVLRELRARLHAALRRFYFDFIRLQTTYDATHFHQLGNHRVSELVWEIDRRLVEIATSFPFLMLVTATNDDDAFASFVESGHRNEPNFHYRFLPVDPEQLKRELFELPIDRVRDATLAYILRDKRDETFQMVDMLANRGNENFRYGSMQVYGGVSDELLTTAKRLLTDYPAPDANRKRDTVDAEGFRAACQRAFADLTAQYPRAAPRVVIRDDMSGLMVSQGVMHIGRHLRVPRHRVPALLQHEINTHVLTYWNGRAQPLTLLHSGTPGYEDLQEGLAVLSEWFVGGMTPARMRILAARVVGIAHMLRGHGFTETFALLHEEYAIPERSAFYTTARIFRGGGFTKDAVYLRGLIELLDYLREGGELEPLFIGKLRLDYVPLLEELQQRGILRPPPLIPKYFREDAAAGHPKLRRLREGVTVFELLSTEG